MYPYRIAPEALQNVIERSEADHVRVELRGATTSICLRVVDDGKGFAANLLGKGGLGLISMRERCLVHGEFAFDSQPTDGTRIEVRVPLSVCRSRKNCFEGKRNSGTMGLVQIASDG